MHFRLFLIVFLCLPVGVQCKVLPKDVRIWETSGSLVSNVNHTLDSLNKGGKSRSFSDPLTGLIHLRNEHATFKTKALRGSLLVFGIEMLSTTVLFITPEKISNWDKGEFSVENCIKNFKRAYTEPPVMDNDMWAINYIGHPYQGAYFYNAVRSQNATILQSALYCFGHSMLWEYVTEAFYEQPSIQDLIVTPISGVILGELVHRGTIRMSRNGFTWFEKVLTILINPMYVLNNGFKTKILYKL